MGDQQLTLAMRLMLDGQQWVHGLRSAGGEIKKFSGSARSEVGSLKDSFKAVRGKLIELGVMAGTTATVIQSARLDKNLDKIGLNAGVGRSEVKQLRGELFKLAQETATPIENLVDTVDLLVRNGSGWSESINLLKAAGTEAARSGEDVATLADAMTNAASSFRIDLSQPKAAEKLLDRISIAATQGKAHLDTLAVALERVGPDAKDKAGLNLEQTLALVQTMAAREGQPRRLLSMFESTVGLFSSRESLRNIQRGAGVPAFDSQGNPRNMLDILDQMKVKYDRLGNRQKMLFMSRVFQGADQNAVKGIETLLEGNNLQGLRSQAQSNSLRSLTSDSGARPAIDNMIDQVERLKAALRDAGDSFARPIKSAIDYAIKFALDKRSQGGLELSGTQLALGAAGAIGAGYLAKRFGGPIVGKLFGLAGGVATGKAIEAAAGVTPVFVTNWPAGGAGGGGILDVLTGAGAGAAATKAAAKVFGGWRAGAALLLGARSVSALGAFGATGIAGAASLVAGAGAVGFGIGKIISWAIEGTTLSDKIGAAVANALAIANIGDSRESIALRKKNESLIRIELDDKRASVKKMESSDDDTNLEFVNLGKTFGGGP
jgi:hypothetical protein